MILRFCKKLSPHRSLDHFDSEELIVDKHVTWG